MLFFLFWLVTTVTLLVLLLGTVRPRSYPPGPKFFPILGNYHYYKTRHGILGYHHLVWSELSKKYGKIVGLKLGRHLVVAVFGSEAVREVLNRDDFDGRPDGFFFRLRTFGKRLGIIFSDGQFWKKQRKFSLQHLRSFGFGTKGMEEKIREETVALMESFKKRCSEPIYIHSAFSISVLNVLWAMLAGQRFEAEDERLTKLLNIIHDSFRLVDMSGGLINQMPFLRYLAPDACGYNQIMNVLNRMWEFLEETIAEHRKTVCLTHPRDLIDAFLQSMDVKNNATFTDDQLMSLCLDLFMAGAETTSNLLGFAVMYLVLHQDIQEKVQKEMDEIVGRNRLPTLNDRLNLKYTEAFLMELQRRANIAPMGIAHRAIKTTQLMGYVIPKDTIILTSLYSVHMDPETWKDPDEFRPERFLDANGDVVTNEKQFFPFGQGKRRCLGESLGKTNLFLFFTSLLHTFRLEPVEGYSPQLDGYDGVTIAPKPFKTKLVLRND